MEEEMELAELGWNKYFEEQFNILEIKKLFPARISLKHGRIYTVYSEKGEMQAEMSGRYEHNAKGSLDYPTIGDWVAIKSEDREGQAIIHNLLNGKSAFIRKAVGKSSDSQLMLANVDTVFIT
jgi:ribosome biogenesis GTPase